MERVNAALRARGGLATVATLRADGLSSGRVERAAKAGQILRVRPGLYAAHTTSSEVVRAARVGGRLAGSSAASAHGLWAPPGVRLVVEVSGSASRLRDPDNSRLSLDLARPDVEVLWIGQSAPTTRVFGLSSLAETLRQVVISEPEEFAVATIDSAIRRTPIDRIQLEEIAQSLPATKRAVFKQADGRPESGTESVLRSLLRRVGLTAHPQVRVPLTDLGRFDFLIGDRLVVECDSGEHHGRAGQRLRDLRRDAALAAVGFIVLRFDYIQVLFEPELVLATILSYVDLGLHLS